MRLRTVLVALTLATAARADLTHAAVSGVAIDGVTLDGRAAHWGELGAPKPRGRHVVRFAAEGAAVAVPHCNGRQRVRVDDVAVPGGERKGPLVVPLDPGAHMVTLEIEASRYEKRLACTEPPRVGAPIRSKDGIATLSFASPERARGGGEAVVFVPGGHDPTRPAALLVGTHPWNGTPWTYAAYQELVAAAGARDVVLLFPSGLGNSLYVADAEEEVLRAIAAMETELAIDPQRISIWGASMGGAGATTIGFHHPDRFAFVASYFGDSRYDLTTYVRGVLGGEPGARRVNALDVLENARWLPVFLVHGEDDHTSPIRQSEMLDAAMRAAGFDVTFVRAPGMEHEGPLVVRHVAEVVDRAARAVAPRRPPRVSFRSTRPTDLGAYGVTFVKKTPDGDAFVDLERRDDGIHVLAAEGVTRIVLARDAFGVTAPVPILSAAVPVGWAP